MFTKDTFYYLLAIITTYKFSLYRDHDKFLKLCLQFLIYEKQSCAYMLQCTYAVKVISEPQPPSMTVPINVTPVSISFLVTLWS